MVEVTDIDDLDKYISQAYASNASDVLQVFNFLRDGSYVHYWAFDNGLKNIGISTGCCSLGDTYCHPEYPQDNQTKNQNRKGFGVMPSQKGLVTEKELDIILPWIYDKFPPKDFRGMREGRGMGQK